MRREVRIPFRLLQQCHADAADHAADALAASDLRIDHCADVVGADDTRHPYDAERRVDHHLHEDRPEGGAGVGLGFVARSGLPLGLQLFDAKATHEGDIVTIAAELRPQIAETTALPTLASVIDPPCTGAFGMSVSPSSK